MICVLARMNISIIFLFMNTMFIVVISDSRLRLISAHRKPEYDNMYEVENAIGIFNGRLLVECSVKCVSNTRCLSFFYNNLTRMCILHSDPFTYTVMSFSEKGWKFYLSQKRCGRCLVNFFYYRELDLCYNLEPPIQVSVVHEDFACQGSELMRFDSNERQDYIKFVTGTLTAEFLKARVNNTEKIRNMSDIGGVYKNGICIQGKKTQGKWSYNNGSRMEYFRWGQNQPSGYSNVIIMVRSQNYKWRNPSLSHKCTYMCKYRSLK